MENEKTKEKSETKEDKPSFLLWLISLFVIIKIPIIFMLFYIFTHLGLSTDIALVISVILGHFATSFYDELNDEVTLFVLKKR